MSDEQSAADEQPSTRERAERRRRLAEVFGDVLPDQTSDDRNPEGGDDAASEEWLKRQVPPHHG